MNFSEEINLNYIFFNDNVYEWFTEIMKWWVSHPVIPIIHLSIEFVVLYQQPHMLLLYKGSDNLCIGHNLEASCMPKDISMVNIKDLCIVILFTAGLYLCYYFDSSLK